MAFTLTPCRDAERWDRLVRESPQGTVFAQTWFLDALEAEADFWLVEEEKGDVALGAVVLKQEGEPIVSPYPFSMYQGLLLSSAYGEMPVHRRVRRSLEAVEFLLASLEPRYERLTFWLHPSLEDVRAFSWFHYGTPDQGRFALDVGYSAILDLSAAAPLDAYLRSIRDVRREEYGRARTRGCRVEESDDVETLERLHKLTFERQGAARSPSAPRQLERIAKSALARGLGWMLVCRDAPGAVLSATLFLHDDRCAYYLVAGNDPAGRSTGSGTFLMIENIRRCMERGLKTLDFVGINSPNRGDFKTSFNGRPVPYFVASWQRPRLAT